MVEHPIILGQVTNDEAVSPDIPSIIVRNRIYQTLPFIQGCPYLSLRNSLSSFLIFSQASLNLGQRATAFS